MVRGRGPQADGGPQLNWATKTAQTMVAAEAARSPDARCPAPSHRALSRLPPPGLLTPDPFAVDGDRELIEIARRVTCNHHRLEHEATHCIDGQWFQPSARRRHRRYPQPRRRPPRGRPPTGP